MAVSNGGDRPTSPAFSPCASARKGISPFDDLQRGPQKKVKKGKGSDRVFLSFEFAALRSLSCKGGGKWKDSMHAIVLLTKFLRVVKGEVGKTGSKHVRPSIPQMTGASSGKCFPTVASPFSLKAPGFSREQEETLFGVQTAECTKCSSPSSSCTSSSSFPWRSSRVFPSP